MNKAKEWATSYFTRLEEKITELQNHPLIEHVNYTSFKGIEEAEVQSIEKHLTMFFKEKENNKEGNDVGEFSFDPYIKEFYKISNGLHLSWDSHIYESSLSDSSILREESIDKFQIAKDELLQAEGFLALVPLANLGPGKTIGVGDPQNSTLGEELTSKGGCFTYIDCFHSYYDTCVNINEDGESLFYLGEDYSASYDDEMVSDFVVYMEYNLATFFSVFLRHKSFFSPEELKERQNYETLSNRILVDLENSNIDKVLRYHAHEADLLEKFSDLDYIKQKTKKIYTKIEEVLDIVIEDEVY